jgi:hypothetical protein
LLGGRTLQWRPPFFIGPALFSPVMEAFSVIISPAYIPGREGFTKTNGEAPVAGRQSLGLGCHVCGDYEPPAHQRAGFIRLNAPRLTIRKNCEELPCKPLVWR